MSDPLQSTTEPEIVFLASQQDLRWGSYRILVHDLSTTLGHLGTPTEIVDSVDALKDLSPEVVLVSKFDASKIPLVRQHLQGDALIGLIQPPRDFPLESIDFALAVSREEEASLSGCKHVLFYPLIELLFHNKPRKEHKETHPLKVFFHGHPQHLHRFESGLSAALDSFHAECPLEFHVVTNNNGLEWTSGRPEVAPVFIHKWELSTVAHLLKDADIGVVPNITDYRHKIPTEETRIDEQGLYHTDYCVRFKNKSNAGRAFVFHQLGVPVITDLTPSNLHILGDPACGEIVSDETGWRKGLKRFQCPDERNRVSVKAREEFTRLYDPLEWGRRLMNQLNTLGTS